MKDLTKISIERRYRTGAYDKLEAFCDDEQGGDSCFSMCDKFDRQQVVNLLIPIIRKEERDKLNEGKKWIKTKYGTNKKLRTLLNLLLIE